MALNRHQQHIEDKMMAPQYLKIINDCARLVNETKNPDVYFSRYDLLMEKAIALNSIKTINFDGDSPTEIVEQVWNKKDQNCYEFIERYAQSVKYKIWSLKTEKGKLAQAESFHDSMLKYYDKMSECNINECERQYYLLLGEASPEYYEKIQEMDLDNTTYWEERETYMPNTNISNETNNEVQVNKPIFCPQCGTANNIGVLFCMNCGYNFEKGEKGTVNAPKQKNVILMRLLLAICIVFLVFVSMFSALLFIMGIVESIPSMAVCGFVFLAGSVVGVVFLIKALSNYPIKTASKQANYPYNSTSLKEEGDYGNMRNSKQAVQSNSADCKYVLKGANGQLYVYENKIEITRKGVWAFAHQGLKGTKTIPISAIKTIQVKKTGLTQGYIQFGVLGGVENRGGLQAANYDENTVTFGNAKDNKTATQIKEYIENLMYNNSKTKSNIVQATSDADELLKFKKLLDDGVITQEEFDAKKKQLLGL